MSAFWQSKCGPAQCQLPALVESHCSHVPMAMLLMAALQGSGGHGESRGKAAGMESSLGLEDPVKEQKSQIVECESQGESSSREGLRFGDGICCSLRGTLPREGQQCCVGSGAQNCGEQLRELQHSCRAEEAQQRPHCSLWLLTGGWGEERSACVTATCTEAELQQFFSAVRTPKAIVPQQECTCCLYTSVQTHATY